MLTELKKIIKEEAAGSAKCDSSGLSLIRKSVIW